MQFLLKEYEEGNTLCTFKGVVHEMNALNRIVITSEMEELPILGRTILEIYEFTALREDRTKLIVQDVCRSVEDRDMMIKSGMEEGLVSIFKNLDELLKQVCEDQATECKTWHQKEH